MSIDGHRQRLKSAVSGHGGRIFHDHQLLELLLFYAIPQGDVNALAHRLHGPLRLPGRRAGRLPGGPAAGARAWGSTPPCCSSCVPKLARALPGRTGPAWRTILDSTPDGPRTTCMPYFLRGAGTSWSICCAWTPSARCWACRKLAEGIVNAARHHHPAGGGGRPGLQRHLRHPGPQPRQRPGLPLRRPTWLTTRRHPGRAAGCGRGAAGPPDLCGRRYGLPEGQRHLEGCLPGGAEIPALIGP